MFIVADLVSLIGPLVSEKIFEIVDGRQTEAGVTGILLAHPSAFGSGELKNVNFGTLSDRN